MSLGNIDIYLIFDMFLLLLIGMGPKIALVPFLELTQGMDAETQKNIANTMVRTAVSTALLLVVLGWFLMRLLHFTGRWRFTRWLYLTLNPTGIAALVIASSDIDSILYVALLIGLVLLVGVINFAVFRNMYKLAKHLDPSRLSITEAIFGVMLAALVVVQLMVDGLAERVIITAVAH